MLVIDENLPASQRQLLRKWRIRFRAVGVDVATPGTQDLDLVPILHTLAKPTLFTLDRHFFRADWAHVSYGLVWLDVNDSEAAEYIRRFLRHPAFDTKSKRLGVVARVGATDIHFWRKGQSHLRIVKWRG
jgi:hypothetical protein